MYTLVRNKYAYTWQPTAPPFNTGVDTKGPGNIACVVFRNIRSHPQGRVDLPRARQMALIRSGRLVQAEDRGGWNVTNSRLQ